MVISWRMWPPKVTLVFYKRLPEIQRSQWAIWIKGSEERSPELWVCSILHCFRQECVWVGKSRRHWRIYFIIKEYYLICFISWYSTGPSGNFSVSGLVMTSQSRDSTCLIHIIPQHQAECRSGKFWELSARLWSKWMRTLECQLQKEVFMYLNNF